MELKFGVCGREWARELERKGFGVLFFRCFWI
jgi:hypothetical protein